MTRGEFLSVASLISKPVGRQCLQYLIQNRHACYQTLSSPHGNFGPRELGSMAAKGAGLP